MRYILILILFLNLNNIYSKIFIFYRTSPALINTNDTFGVTSYAQINNLMSGNNQLRLIKSSNSFPAGWESCICDIVQCHPPGTDTAIANYPHGISDIAVMIYTHSIPGTGYITIRTEKVSNPNEHIDVVFGCSYNPIGIHQISTIVKNYSLSQNYPNPFNPSTKINFSITSNQFVSLIVYDILGREISVLVSEHLSEGE